MPGFSPGIEASKFLPYLNIDQEGLVLKRVLNLNFDKTKFEFTKLKFPMGILRPAEIPALLGLIGAGKSL